MSVSEALSRQDSFQKNLAFGQIAESAIAKWLLSRGNAVLPIYDIEYETGKGPRLFTLGNQMAAPDLLVWKSGKAFWCEAKHKEVFTWYRKKRQWETGIDLHHWRHYLRVSDETKLPVWLLFLHRSSTPSIIDRKQGCCPPICPVGLFGQTCDRLKPSGRTSDKWGRHGMIYWGAEDLRLLASAQEMSEYGWMTEKRYEFSKVS